MTSNGELCFIDFGFFGPGYNYTDVAMGAMMVPSEHRDKFLKGYYGSDHTGKEKLVMLEGFMLLAIIGYYVFQMENESVHAWMRERMPKLCADYCMPSCCSWCIFIHPYRPYGLYYGASSGRDNGILLARTHGQYDGFIITASN